MVRSREKSQFLCCQKDAWDRLAEEAWLHGELTEQLITACQKVVELAPADEEVTSLRIREAGACQHANKSEEKLMALAERACLDDVDFEQLRKKRDELLQAVEGLRTKHDSTRRERANT
jgi:hypothetical protein